MHVLIAKSSTTVVVYNRCVAPLNNRTFECGCKPIDYTNKNIQVNSTESTVKEMWKIYYE